MPVRATPLRQATFITAAAVLALGGTCAHAQQDGANAITGSKIIEVQDLGADVEVDGVLNEEVWARAARVDDFHQMNPVDFRIASRAVSMSTFFSDAETVPCTLLLARMFKSP